MWFNSSSSALKGYGTAAGIPAATWASGGSLSTARTDVSGAGTQTAGLAVGGEQGLHQLIQEQLKNIMVQAWSNGGSMNTARAQVAASKQVFKLLRYTLVVERHLRQ